jgi:hypothetical protein
MRNHFEHYDERLDEWWAKSPDHHNIADMNVMPVGSLPNFDELSMFRQLDPTTMEVVFWGDKFNMRRSLPRHRAFFRSSPKRRQSHTGRSNGQERRGRVSDVG